MQNKLTTTIAKLIQPVAGQTAIVVWQNNSEIFAHHSEKMLPAASLIKLPILAGTLAAVQRGRVSLETTVTVSKQQMVGGSGVLQLLPDRAWHLKELLALMIADSDNSATNQVIDLVGFEWLQKWIAEQSNEALLQRRLMDFKAAEKGAENLISAQAAGNFFRMVLAEKANKQLIHSWFAHQQFRDKLPGLFDELDWPLTVLNKTGEGAGVDHDVARFINSAGQTVDIALMTSGIPDRLVTKKLFNQIGQAVAQYTLRLAEQ